MPTTAAAVRRRNREAEPPGFAEWYDWFPRKEGRFAACRAYKKALMVADAETIMSGLMAYRFHADREFQPHPETWLNKRRWECDNDSPVTHPHCVERSKPLDARSENARRLRELEGRCNPPDDFDGITIPGELSL